MSERGNLQAQLNAGIEAVHAGDRATARKLLQQVIRADPRNEVAWMWMASAVTDPDERRACLERALAINPQNTRAKEALRRLELSNPPAPGRESASRLPANLPTSRRGRSGNIYLVLAVVVLVVIVAAVVFAVSNSPTTPSGGLNSTGIPGVGLVPTQTPTIDPTTYTATPVLAVVVTIDRSQSSLPPTFTPTFTPPPTSTAVPTATPPPLNTYTLLYSEASGQVYRLKADGSGEAALPSNGGAFRDIAVDPSGKRIAFVRDVLDPSVTEQASSTEDPNATPPVGPVAHPQLFVASISNLNDAAQVTTMSGTQLERPSWSPDGSTLAFGSDTDSTLDIYTVPVTGGVPQRLTKNSGVDKDPAWSPNGDQIAYASDQNSPAVKKFPGTTEIFLINADGTGTPTQLTDAGGNSFWPSWSPDGKQIVFVSDRSGDSDLYIMSAQGEGQDLITFDDQGAEDRAPTYESDGRWIVFTSNRETQNFQAYLIDPAGNTVKRVTQNDRDIEAVSFLPAGS